MSLRPVALTDEDNALVATALRVIAANHEKGRHHIGAAVRMRGGRVFAGIHVEAHVGRVTLCAEAVALGPRSRPARAISRPSSRSHIRARTTAQGLHPPARAELTVDLGCQPIDDRRVAWKLGERPGHRPATAAAATSSGSTRWTTTPRSRPA